jgi:CRISPR-associated protein Cas6
MKTGATEMIDMVFDLSGVTPPASYPFVLWTEMLELAPQLAAHEYTGILPLRLPPNSAGTLLQKRAKLVIRLPVTVADQTGTRLSGQQIEVDGSKMKLGHGKKRPLQPYPTIHAHIVAGNSDEVLFMEDVKAEIGNMGISGNLICGKRSTLMGERQSIHGYSLVIHDLKPDASLKLQYAGLGSSHRFGCGIFIPYKVISGLSDD